MNEFSLLASNIAQTFISLGFLFLFGLATHALGMALIAVQRLLHLRYIIFPVVIRATVIFEIIGPIMTRFALLQTNEIRPANHALHK